MLVPGENCHRIVDLRINGIDAPENKKTPTIKTDPSFTEECRKITKDIGKLATGKLIELLKQPDNSLKFKYKVVQIEKYGRILADIYTLDNKNIGQELISVGLAIPYDGGTRKKDYWCNLQGEK